MILNLENDEMTEQVEELKTAGPENEPTEESSASDASEENASEPDTAPDAINDSDPSNPSDPSNSSDENDPANEDTSADVTYEGDRPLVQELQYQQVRGKTTTEDEEAPEETHFSSVAEARAVIEGFLFSSNEPLSVKRLSKLMNNLHPKTVRGLLLELQWEYENRAGALQVVEIAGGYQLSTRAFVAPWMFRLHKLKRRSPLSPATLETLAIVAYRQPITKGEIEGIRGVETGAPIRTLQELGLIEASGRREVIGRPQLYVTTEQFLKIFGLNSLADLPSIAELKSRFAEEQRLKPKVTKPEEPAAPPTPEEPESSSEDPESSDATLESSSHDPESPAEELETPREKPEEPEMLSDQEPEPEIESIDEPEPEIVQHEEKTSEDS